MSFHTPHEPIETHGLADGCPRCTEIAADPLGRLDERNCTALILRTAAWMAEREYPRSATEAKAMRAVEALVGFARSRVGRELLPQLVGQEEG